MGRIRCCSSPFAPVILCGIAYVWLLYKGEKSLETGASDQRALTVKEFEVPESLHLPIFCSIVPLIVHLYGDYRV